MDGPKLHQYLLRRLKEANLTLEDDRVEELYDLLTQGRDDVLTALAQVSVAGLQAPFDLVQDGTNPLLFAIPSSSRDIIKVYELREKASGRLLRPSSVLNVYPGDYVWYDTRTIKLSDAFDATAGIEFVGVLAGPDITSASKESDIGLPTTCHRAIGLAAAVLALTTDEETDASNAKGLLDGEIAKLAASFGDRDVQDGAKLSDALLGGYVDRFRVGMDGF